ncbi:MAG: hypothetical protein FJX45_04930 [Alphaproteobacteria bacterium]|nr:hypothetical protein [Alphaproteobacteria bacterium]MBM3652930.1 hypothetical protein [Alphaproteobacteria bacterium]
MAMKLEGRRALADLAAGKFSFEMVDAIKDHVGALETELERVRTEAERTGAQYERSVNAARQQEYRIFRLEADLCAANARVYALLKANALTQTAVGAAKRGVESVVEYLPVARKHAEDGSKAALAYLATVDFKGKFEALKAHPMTEKAIAWLAELDVQAEWTKLKTHPLTQRALSELQQGLLKAKEYSPVVQKQIAVAVEKTTAYIAERQKKAA